MKKLKLKALELTSQEPLTRAQLKKIMGGAGSGGGCNTESCTTNQKCEELNKDCGPCVDGRCT